MCHGSVKKIVHTAQSIRFARLAGAKLNFLPNGFTRLGPTNSSAGALAAIGIEARIVIPTMIPSACVTVRDTVFSAHFRILSITPLSTRICVTARTSSAKMIAPTTPEMPLSIRPVLWPRFAGIESNAASLIFPFNIPKAIADTLP